VNHTYPRLAVVNIAGTGHLDRVVDLGLETWHHALATDLDGPFPDENSIGRPCSSSPDASVAGVRELLQVETT